jgi:tetratricopeptide (TPR) repeat protein
LYERAGRWEPSLTELDQWIKAHAESPELWGALMRRCWVRAALNREMDRALADCNRAVSMSLKASEALDTRGLVHVLRGEDTAALSDFNATLALHPRSAWALFGRSLVERRKGEAKDAAADLAASVAIDRDILEQAKRVGLAP